MKVPTAPPTWSGTEFAAPNTEMFLMHTVYLYGIKLTTEPFPKVL